MSDDFASLEELLAELDRQEALEEGPGAAEHPPQEESLKEEDAEALQKSALGSRLDDDRGSLEEEAGGSSSSSSGLGRQSGRFSKVCLGGPAGSPEPNTNTVAQEAEQPESGAGLLHPLGMRPALKSEEPEDSETTHLPPLSALLAQLDGDAASIERRHAQEEAAAFEERQLLARLEAEATALEDRRRRAERAREERERQCMAAEEAEERRTRANSFAAVLEGKTRRQVEKEAAKRRQQKLEAFEERRRQRRMQQAQRSEEQLRRRAHKMSEKMRRMAENGYALGAGGWVRLDWLPDEGPAAGADSLSEASDAEEEQISEASGPEADAGSDGLELEVVDQQPQPADEQRMPEAAPLDELLADLDQRCKEGWASLDGDKPPALEEVLDVLEAEERRDEAKTAAAALRSSFEELGSVADQEEDGESATVLRAAKARRPVSDFSTAISAESALKPWNDFVEEKQEGANSYEERQARSAAIQAKLQAARNRMSLVRYQKTD